MKISSNKDNILHNDKKFKILAFAAHPDDFAYSLTGTRYKFNNTQIHLIDVFSQSVFLNDCAYSKCNAKRISEIRKNEEINYCKSNNIQITFLDFPDSSLRGYKNYFKINTEKQLYLKIYEALNNYVSKTSYDVILRPLSIGGHVDHIMLDCVLTDMMKNVKQDYFQIYYEDLPYAAEISDKQVNDFISKKACGPINQNLITFDNNIMNKKIEQLSKFASQVTSTDIMNCRNYAKKLTHNSGKFAERLWRF